ncbi:MAG TPA: hypothetical protein VGA13_12205 [Acidimicrobiales bacterium]
MSLLIRAATALLVGVVVVSLAPDPRESVEAEMVGMSGALRGQVVGRGFTLEPGDVVVAENAPGRVLIVDRDFDDVDVIASGLDQPHGVAIDTADGSVLIAEFGAGRVIRLLPTGDVDVLDAPLDAPEDVVVEPGGAVVVSDREGGRVVRITGAGSEIVADALAGPAGVDAAAGMLAVAVRNTPPDGQILAGPVGGTSLELFNEPFQVPAHIDVSPDGLDVFLADEGGRIVSARAGGAKRVIRPGNLDLPVGLAIDSGAASPGDETLLTSVRDGLLRLHIESGETLDQRSLDDPVGIDVVPETVDDPPPSTTSSSTSTSTTQPGVAVPQTTVSTDLGDAGGGNGGGGGSGIPLVPIAIGACGLAVLWFILRQLGIGPFARRG